MHCVTRSAFAGAVTQGGSTAEAAVNPSGIPPVSQGEIGSSPV
jgi:hypothetical protein